MPKTSVAASQPLPESINTVSTAVLEARVYARGLCTIARPTADNDPWDLESERAEKAIPAARKACAGCPVIAECLEWTLREEATIQAHHIHGARAGLAPAERRELIKQRSRIGGDR